MLILARKKGERIMIGDDVILTIMDIRRDGQVRIGVSAPDDTRVDREEVRAAMWRDAMLPRSLD